MDHPESIVIVGAGMAGTRAAEALRSAGFDGSVTLLSAETPLPYDRVPLSKHHLMGEPGFHRLFIQDEGWYATNEILLRLDTTASAIDPSRRRVVLTTGEELPFDRLLLSTGADARRLSVPGADLAGVHHLRTLGDADGLRAALGEAARLVVIGDGFIGCEVTASARTLGVEVTLIGRGPLPMQRALGPEMAGYFGDLHAAHGVALRPNAEVVALKGTDHVDTVVLADGTELAADTVLVGIGAVPRTELARGAGIAVDNGVATDQFLETDVAGIYAAGDVAAVWNPVSGRRDRHEHWATALHQGPTAARNMLGERAPFEHTPFFFTDQYDVWLEYTGSASPGDELVVRGDPSAGEAAEFIAFWLHDERLTAGMNVNVKGVPSVIREIIRSQRRVDRSALADPSVPLAEL